MVPATFEETEVRMAVSNEEQMMIDLVAEFIDEQVKPSVNKVEHANEYPEAWIRTMKDMGIYGLAIDEPWGAGKVSTEAYALITQELARGWMSLAGAMGGHTVVAKLIQEYGTHAAEG
jgi:alkylation response protein AidB-like acyl-CoA dehydrogenase